MDEVDVRDLEAAWPGLVLNLEGLHARLPPPEAGVFEAIVRAAAADVAWAETPAPPPELGGNGQPQRDRLTRGLLDALARLPGRLNLGPPGGTPRHGSGAGSGTAALPLVGKLAAIAPNAAEREGVRTLLGTAASGLARGSGELPPPDVSDPGVFSVVVEALRLLQHHHRRLPPGGIAWRGRPEFLTQVVLDELRAEAAGARGDAIPLARRSLARAGQAATRLSTSAPLVALVNSVVGACEPTGRAAYVYYDSPGHGVYPHVDYSAYALTALFLVTHDHRGAPQSRHFHFHPDGRVECPDLHPGEVLLFSGGSVVHGRTPVARDEAVVVLTTGFRPL